MSERGCWLDRGSCPCLWEVLWTGRCPPQSSPSGGRKSGVGRAGGMGGHCLQALTPEAWGASCPGAWLPPLRSSQVYTQADGRAALCGVTPGGAGLRRRWHRALTVPRRSLRLEAAEPRCFLMAGTTWYPPAQNGPPQSTSTTLARGEPKGRD